MSYNVFYKYKNDHTNITLYGHRHRRDKIRTCDLYVPNVALYQTEPHAVYNYVIIA